MSAVQGPHEYFHHRAPHETLYGYCWCWRSVVVVQSLKSACCNVLVRDARLLCRILPSVPNCFIALLLAKAIEDGRDRAAELLVSVWPNSTLNLQSVLTNNCHVMHHPRRVIATTALVRTFAELSLNGASNNIHLLDVTGFQLGRELMDFIVRKMTVFSKRQFGQSSRTLRCDFLVDEDYSFGVFCALLNHSLSKSVLRFDVRNLEVEGIGEAKLVQLLGMLDPEPLIGLSVAYNSLQNQGLLHVLLNLRRFQGLVALDLSSNGMRRGDTQHYIRLAATIRSLPQVRRLNIKSCRIGGFLNALLTPCNSQLSHLDVSACGLRGQDLGVLQRFQGLRCLVLSDNNLSGLIPELSTLLVSLPHLQVVLLSNCDLRPESFEIVWDALRVLGKVLRWLDLTWNKLSEENLVGIAQELEAGGLPQLVRLLVPVPSNPSPSYFEVVKRFEAASPIIRVQTDLV